MLSVLEKQQCGLSRASEKGADSSQTSLEGCEQGVVSFDSYFHESLYVGE